MRNEEPETFSYICVGCGHFEMKTLRHANFLFMFIIKKGANIKAKESFDERKKCYRKRAAQFYTFHGAKKFAENFVLSANSLIVACDIF